MVDITPNARVLVMLGEVDIDSHASRIFGGLISIEYRQPDVLYVG